MSFLHKIFRREKLTSSWEQIKKAGLAYPKHSFSILKLTLPNGHIGTGWVDKGYKKYNYKEFIKEIQKTKSPYRSQKSLSSIVEIDIDISKEINDTLEVGAPSIHEGYSFHIIFTNGIATNSVKTNIIDYENKDNFYDLGYRISGKDTTLIIYHYNKSKKLLGQLEYKKAAKITESALQYMVNKTLFSGNYKTIDSAGRILSLNFSDDGIVTGLPNYKNYYVVTDFVAGPENNLDELCFDIQTNNQKCYTYKIKGNTIELYDTKESEEHINLLIGQLKYKLIKQ